MAAIRRYFYVGPPEGKTYHISSAPHLVEGEITWCGKHFFKGWKYWIGKPKDRTLCKMCAAQRVKE